MFLTEKESKEKKCVIGLRSIDLTYNCLGSRCMAWRFQGSNSKKGFCGLAGVPLSNMVINKDFISEQKEKKSIIKIPCFKCKYWVEKKDDFGICSNPKRDLFILKEDNYETSYDMSCVGAKPKIEKLD